MIKLLNYVTPFYCNQKMLQVHIQNWESYPPEILNKMSIIIVDDGSPEGFEAEPILKGTKLPIRLFRVDVDIPWNQHGARNLGMKFAGKEFTLLTDIDNLFDVRNIRKVFKVPVKKQRYYTFCRYKVSEDTDWGLRLKKPTLLEYKYHPNSFLLNPADFWKTGGYSTKYCGTYGGDGAFTRDLDKVALKVHLDANVEGGPVYLNYFPRGFLPDAGTQDNAWGAEGNPRKGFFKDEYRRRFDLRESIQSEEDSTPFPWREINLNA